MKLFDIFGFALSNFLRRKARSALTVFGVVIGTAAVVIMLSIGIGMNKGIEDQLGSRGNLKEISVYTKTGTYNEETDEWEAAAVVEPLDDISLANIKSIEHVKAVSPMQWSNYINFIVRNKKEKIWYPNFQGIDASAMEDLGYEVVVGRLLDERDVGTYNFVLCYNLPFEFNDVHETDWQNLVRYYESSEGEELPMNPVNEFDDDVFYELTWDSNYASGAVDTTKPKVKAFQGKCVGVLVQNLQNGSTDWSHEAYMDIKGLQELDKLLEENQNKYYSDMYGEEVVFGYSYDDGNNYADGRENLYQNLTVIVDDVDNVLEVQDQINAMEFQTDSQMDWIRQQQDQTKFLRSVLGAIGAVAFFVAAISIANTMVMSIYERTREIGIMKVIGCKLSDIRGMFLVEAAIIGIVGGLLGVGLSYGASMLVNKLAAGGGMEAFGIYSSEAKLSIIPFWLDIAAVILAIGVGVISGLYPAIRATRLSALEAIKNE